MNVLEEGEKRRKGTVRTTWKGGEETKRGKRKKDKQKNER